MKLILRTLRQGRTVEQPLKKGRTVLRAEAGVEYQVVDENGRILEPEKQGSDLLWQDGDKARPTVLRIENANAYHGELLPVSGSPAAPAPALTASEAGIGKAVLLGLGAAGVIGGIAALASRGGDDKDGQDAAPPVPNTPPANPTVTPNNPVVPNNPATPTTPAVPNNPPATPNNPTAPVVPNNPPATPSVPAPPPAAQPVITFDPVTDDNTLNLAESRRNITVSGSVANAKDGDTITLHVGDTRNTAVIKDGRFSTEVDGHTLAHHQTVRATHQSGSEQTHGYRLALNTPQPKLHLNPVTGDNVIDKTEAAQTEIEVSGRTEGVADGSTVVVVCGCPLCSGVSREATVQNGTFRVTFAGSDLIADGHHMITARVRVVDEAGNVGEDQDVQNYEPAADLSPATITWDNIAGDNIVNKTEAAGKVALSGSIAGLKDGETATLAIKIGDRTVHEAQAQNGRFHTEVDAKQLAGQKPATAVLTIDGKQGEITAPHSYHYDTEIQNPQIGINPINGGKTINQQDSLGQITVSGSLNYENDINPAATKITLSINGKELSDPVSVSGSRWETQIKGDLLADKQDGNSLTVRARIQDMAGNTAEHSETVSYKADTLAPTATVTLDKIAGDNVLDHQEAEQSITVSGKVTGEFKAGDTVTLTANGREYNSIAVKADGSFSQTVQGSDLAVSGSREVKAYIALTDDAGNRNTVQSETVVYEVKSAPTPLPPPPPVPTPAPVPEAAIRLHDLDAAALSRDGFTRLTGKVDWSGTAFDKFKNAGRVYGVEVQIGGKTYTSAVQADRSFYIDVADADLPSLNGQTPVYTVRHANTVYDLKYASQSSGYLYKVDADYAPKLDGNHVKWDKQSAWFDASGSLNIAPKADTVAVRGTVSGAAKAGDTVLLKVGDTTVSTQVSEQKEFSADVSREKLAAAGEVKAELQQGGKTVAHGGAAVSREHQLSGEFVSQHQHVNPEDRPYFLNALIPNNNIYFIYTAPFGQADTPVLRYGFAEYKNDMPFSADNRQAVRRVWDIIEKYANVKFEEVSADQTGIHYHLRDLPYGMRGNADYGGSVRINKNFAGADGKGLVSGSSFGLVLHETMHSLGAKHPINYNRENYPHVLSTAENLLSNTVLSYATDQESRPDLRLYDLAFLHYRFGVNRQARAGDDVYRFKPHNRGTADNDIYIWDGGGVDTFDASDQKQGVTVNLTPGSWIYAGEKSNLFAVTGLGNTQDKQAYLSSFFGKESRVGIEGDIVDKTDGYIYSENQAFIGYGTQIERLIGSDHNDTLTGNNADNAIYGGKGSDTIKGGGGNDYLDGGAGADTLAGEAGNDTYVVDNENDRVNEAADAGNDTVHSYINFRLPENVENLHLFGSAREGTGNALSNDIKGNAQDNILNGGAGADTLTGGAGKDTFVFSDLLEADSITDFKVGEDKIGLKREAFSDIGDAEQAAQRIAYDASNGHLSYNGQHFATIGTGLTLDENSFTLV